MSEDSLILGAFRDPASIASLALKDWDLLVRQARVGNLLPSLHAILVEQKVIDAVPAEARTHFEWARVIADKHFKAVEWEVAQIRAAMADTGIPVILLKGAAYVMAKLPPAQGRLFSDVDIMVPKDRLAETEAALMMHGWAATQHDAYDQRYYRTWMHELPPMQHVKRMTIIDVHHAIVPETAPIHPDSNKLRAAARPVEGADDPLVFAPEDIVLHSAVHLFHDGEMDNGLRDLVDLHRLLQHFGTLPSFWTVLVERAKDLELTRPLFYALRYTSQLLHTNIPQEAMKEAQYGRPSALMLKIMDGLFSRVLLPPHRSCSDWSRIPAQKILYLRANWLRMPPLLLARHLFHKAFISPKSK